MSGIKLCLDHKSCFSKPKDEEVARISKRIANQSKLINSKNIRGFVEAVALDGRTFCPATFKEGERRKDNFEQIQMFGLDFDNDKPENKISFDTVKDRAEQCNLPILFAYDTFSSKNHDKFRVVFANDGPIENPVIAGGMLQALSVIFPEADKTCTKDISKMYFGGKGLLHIDETLPTINPEALFRNMTVHLRGQHGATHYKRKLAEFSHKTGLGLNRHGLLDVSVVDESAEGIGAIPNGKFSPNSYTVTIKRTIGEKLPNRYYQINLVGGCTSSLSEKVSVGRSTYRSSILKELGSACRLYHEFETGGRALEHDELFGLATNLIQVESGIDRFRENLRANPDVSVDTLSRWDLQLRYIKTNRYKPSACSNYCPYCDTCAHGKNLLSTSVVRSNHFEIIEGFKESYVSEVELDEDLRASFHRAASNDKMLSVVNAQTASGKTRAYLEFIRNTSLRVLVAVPTNILKHEVRGRAAACGVELTESPSLHELKDELPPDIWNEIERLYKSGKSRIPFITKLIREDHPECAALLKQYLRELDAFTNAGGHAITTHRRLCTMDYSKYDLVIIDEDIIYSTIIPNKIDIPVSKLKKLLKKAAANSSLAAKIEKIIEYSDTKEELGLFELSEISYDKRYADIKMAVDIPALCSAVNFCFRKASKHGAGPKKDTVSFMNPVQLNPNVKHVMVSATANENICNYVFGEGNVDFYACKRKAYEGKLNQYHKKSMSRADIAKNPAIIRRIKRLTGVDNEHTITFKAEDMGELHYGNAVGCDTMKGADLDVIGTPHMPEWIYKLFASSILSDCDFTAKLHYRRTEHNGVRFWFTTYDDDDLRGIQFYIIETELEQAVGRARLLRHDCTVNLFSNFPLRQADYIDIDYSKGSEIADEAPTPHP